MCLLKSDTQNEDSSLSGRIPAKHTSGTITVFILDEIISINVIQDLISSSGKSVYWPVLQFSLNKTH